MTPFIPAALALFSLGLAADVAYLWRRNRQLKAEVGRLRFELRCSHVAGNYLGTRCQQNAARIESLIKAMQPDWIERHKGERS